MPIKYKSQYLTATDGAKIYYTTDYVGTKPPLVLLHGASGDESTWNGFREVMHAHGYSTITIDLRGHGFSDRSSKSSFYSADAIIQDIIQIIQQEKLHEYVLTGQCYGATLMMKVAAQAPAGLKALILMNSSYESGFRSLFIRIPFRNTLVRLVEHLPNIGKAGQTDFTKFIGTGNFNIPRIIVTVWKTTTQSILLTFNQVFSVTAEEDLKKIHCPVCIIGADKDIFFPPDVIHDLADKLKPQTVAVIQGADHIMCLNNPQEVADIVTSFLKKVGL